MKKPGSILKVKEFSESEDEEAEEEVAMDQSGSEDIEEEAEDDDQPGTSNSLKVKDKKKKKGKKGIIYISTIPKHMNVAICRDFLERFGEVNRIFLQPDSKGMTKKANKKKKNVTFTEGWVEFEKKKVAKFVAQNINATPISTKKGTKFCDILWSLKYLPGFKWIHLSERLTYERAVQHQKLQIATSKARKEADFFQNNLDKSERFTKDKKKVQKSSD